MSRRKPTRTQKTITNINRYIQRIADTFGQFSGEYEQVTRELHRVDEEGNPLFELRTNKAGVVQIANTKANRKHHAVIRGIKNRQKPINILSRKYKNLPPPPIDDQAEQPRTFTQWYAESMKEFQDLYDEIYNYLIPACDELGIYHDEPKAYYINHELKMEKWKEVFESGARDYASVKEFLNAMKEQRQNMSRQGNSYVDNRSGEVMTQTNDDYPSFAEQWTDIEY